MDEGGTEKFEVPEIRVFLDLDGLDVEGLCLKGGDGLRAEDEDE